MNPMSFLNRSVLVAAVVLAGAAVAQPANDACGNAEVITPSSVPGQVVTSNTAVTFGAALALEAPFTCLTTPTNSNSSVWYTITPAISGTYRIETCPSTAPGTTVADTVIAVYQGDCGAPTTITNGCADQGGCASQSRVTVQLTAGTQYWVQAGKYGATPPGDAGVSGIQVSVTYQQTAPFDTCGPTSPELPLNRTVVVNTNAIDAGFSLAANDAQLDGGAACFTGLQQNNTAATGRDVAYRFRAPATGSYNFRAGLPSSSVNTVLYLTNTCVAGSPGQYTANQCVAATNRNGDTSTSAEQISCVPMTANQEVFVWVDEASSSTAGAAIPVEVAACFAETEPNNSPATASALSCATTGGIGVAGDIDYFAIGAPPAGSRVYALVEAIAAYSSSFDFDLRVTTATRTIEYDDWNAAAAFGESSGVIAGAPIGGEPAYLQVSYYNQGGPGEPYVLYSHVTTGAPTPEIEPNETVATATGGSMYFSGAIQDGGNDVDFFQFTANEGDVIFAALDSVPDKADAGTTATFNFALRLVDSAGNTLVNIDDTSSQTVTLSPTDAGLLGVTPTLPAEALVYRARSTGTYALRVGKSSGTTNTAYHLAVSVGCSSVAPTISGFTPTSGTPAGGLAVTITGTNFDVRSVVRIGSNIAAVDSVSPTELVVRTPSSATGGAVNVTVTNGIGLTATAGGQFTYEDPAGVPPTLTSVSPLTGPTAGGTLVTLTGSVFRADAGVFFDVGGVTHPATTVTRNSTTQLVATTPAHTQGAAVVTIINSDGLSAQLDAGFTYLGPPTIAAVTPNTGFTSGGQAITVTGSNFRTGTTVRVGANLATAVTIAADGLSLTAVTPSSTVNGAVNVVVTNADTQTVTLTGGYTYNYAPPTLASVSPTNGFVTGNTLITLTGANFLAAPTVTIGGNAATAVTRGSATSITARTPAGTAGPQPIVVTNSDGQATTATVNFTYVAAPTLASITPSNGSAKGGTRITISGSSFIAGARVAIGGVPAFAVAVSNPTTLTATTNAGTAGTYDVVVTNPDTQSGSLTAAFTVDGAPALTALSPISGSSSGGTVITLTGSGFRQGAAVLFGSTPATDVTVTSDTELTATTAMHALGVVSVTVRNQDGQTGELPRSFRFVDPPTLTAIAPTSGDVAGGTSVRLTGSGFSEAATVTFGGVESSLVTLVSATELDAVAPAHAAGAVDVVVTVEGAAASLSNAFTYTRGAPSVAAAAPRAGPVEGGTLVTITGSGFVDGATVTFGGTAATGVVVAAADLIRAVAPAHAAGVVDIVVTNNDAQAGTLSGGFTYTAASGGPDNSITDGGSGAVGTDPSGTPTPGGVSCGCTSFDGSMFGFAGLGLVALLSRRRRRS